MTARPAALQASVETQTPAGGVTRAWSTVATTWVELRASAGGFEQAEGQRPVRVETASATARDHPLAAAGQQLVLDDEPPWRVLAVRRGEPAAGRMTLLLDRAG